MEGNGCVGTNTKSVFPYLKRQRTEVMTVLERNTQPVVYDPMPPLSLGSFLAVQAFR